MQAYTSGSVPLEKRERGTLTWIPTENPEWNWEKYEYRVGISYRKKMLSMFEENDIKHKIITFGCNEHWTDTGEKKILFDSYFRRHLESVLEIGDVTKFFIIPASLRSKEILESVPDKK